MPAKADRLLRFPSLIQTTLFSGASQPVSSTAKALLKIANYLDTLTWLIIKVGPNRECMFCKGTCNCPAGPTPPVAYTELCVGKEFHNIQNSIHDLTENGFFPTGTLVVSKGRERKQAPLIFYRVYHHRLIQVPADAIEKAIDWDLITKLIESRKSRKRKREDFLSAI